MYFFVSFSFPIGKFNPLSNNGWTITNKAILCETFDTRSWAVTVVREGTRRDKNGTGQGKTRNKATKDYNLKKLLNKVAQSRISLFISLHRINFNHNNERACNNFPSTRKEIKECTQHIYILSQHMSQHNNSKNHSHSSHNSSNSNND